MIKLNHPHLKRQVSRGTEYFYYRYRGKLVAIKGADGERLRPTDPGFMAAYEAIHATFKRPDTAAPGRGTLDALIVEYLQSSRFNKLAPRTKKDYLRFTDLLRENYGTLSVRTMPRPFVFALQEKYAATGRKANYIISMLRILMQFAVDMGYRNDNPVSKPGRIKEGDGHRPWEEYEIEAFRRRFPEPCFERAAFELLLNTAQRGGDVIELRRQHRFQGTISVVAQNKTGERLIIPEADELTAILDPYLASHDGMMLLIASTGKPFLVDNFRHRMKAAYRAAGLHDVTTHGLRYTAATRIRELTGDWEVVGALTGHRTAGMARQYTKQKRDAEFAVTSLNDRKT